MTDDDFKKAAQNPAQSATDYGVYDGLEDRGDEENALNSSVVLSGLLVSSCALVREGLELTPESPEFKAILESVLHKVLHDSGRHGAP